MSQYQEFASGYDLTAAIVGYGHVPRKISALFGTVAPPLQAGAEVLDFGAGTGRLTRAILSRQPQARITALEPASNMLQIARRKLKDHANVHFMGGGYSAHEGLPFEDARFDAIASSGVFEHIRIKPPVMREFLRVMKPGAHFAFTYSSYEGRGGIKTEDRRINDCDLQAYRHTARHVESVLDATGAELRHHRTIRAYWDFPHLRFIRYGVALVRKPA